MKPIPLPPLLVKVPRGTPMRANTKQAEGIDTFLLKFDVAGVSQWNQTYTLPDDYMDCDCLVATSDGGFALSGRTYYSDIFLIKTDEIGIVPETTWAILPFLAIATVFFICGKKFLNNRSKES